jgi:hypothetical protein
MHCRIFLTHSLFLANLLSSCSHKLALCQHTHVVKSSLVGTITSKSHVTILNPISEYTVLNILLVCLLSFSLLVLLRPIIAASVCAVMRACVRALMHLHACRFIHILKNATRNSSLTPSIKNLFRKFHNSHHTRARSLSLSLSRHQTCQRLHTNNTDHRDVVPSMY